MKAISVVGLGFGDEGKGSIVDAIVQREGARLVVRFNGGCQAAHHVVLADGRDHCFAQLGSGTLAGADTLLTNMVVDPFALERERMALESTFGVGCNQVGYGTRLTIDAGCLVTTPLHAALNRARELARTARHGSCGRGVGEAVDFAMQNPMLALVVGDLSDEGVTYRKLRAFVDIMREDWQALGAQECLAMPRAVLDTGFEPSAKMAAELLAYAYLSFARRYTDNITDDPLKAMADALQAGPVVFEGAHGVLLDQWHGFHPHTTWATTTDKRVAELLNAVQFTGERLRVGVLRSYMTRHGHGPLPTEGRLTVDTEYDHNKPGAWQGPLRVGAFDGVLAKYAVAANGGIDCIALTHMDVVCSGWPVAVGYRGDDRLLPATTYDDVRLAWQEAVGRQLSPAHEAAYAAYKTPETFASAVGKAIAPVGILSRGPTAADKEFLPVYTGERVTT